MLRMAMNKKYYWQKTKVCEKCHFNDDPGPVIIMGTVSGPNLNLRTTVGNF